MELQIVEPKINTLAVSELNNATAQKNSINGSNKGRFHRSLRFFQEHCFEPIRVTDLARAAKLSKRGLHKAFQKHIGRSPGRELRRLRIERAKALLVNSNCSLKIIAKMCGYKNVNSFWVSFRENVGESPGKFRSRFS